MKTTVNLFYSLILIYASHKRHPTLLQFWLVLQASEIVFLYISSVLIAIFVWVCHDCVSKKYEKAYHTISVTPSLWLHIALAGKSMGSIFFTPVEATHNNFENIYLAQSIFVQLITFNLLQIPWFGPDQHGGDALGAGLLLVYTLFIVVITLITNCKQFIFESPCLCSCIYFTFQLWDCTSGFVSIPLGETS